MVTFGEPLEDEPPEGLTAQGRRKSGWHKKSKATWEARKRAEKAKPKKTRKPVVRPKRSWSKPVEEPCPGCYAPMRDGICTGAFHTRERLAGR